MDLQTRKLELIKEFLKVQQEDVILQLEKILNVERKNLDSKKFDPMTEEEFNARIDASMHDAKQDNMISTKALEKEIDSWS
ncbi:MAG: hypothetical protein CL868_12715 [Cytophagaceae bacterium]|nr:hypothetical protein [Cytophagaceae bacterium]